VGTLPVLCTTRAVQEAPAVVAAVSAIGCVVQYASTLARAQQRAGTRLSTLSSVDLHSPAAVVRVVDACWVDGQVLITPLEARGTRGGMGQGKLLRPRLWQCTRLRRSTLPGGRKRTG
jgi:hypothetical protein